MKKILTIVFFFILIQLNNSCRSEVDSQITPTAKTLARNKNFQEISKILISNLNKNKNFTELKKISNKTSLSNNDRKLLFINLGFQDATDFNNFQNDLIQLNQKLSNDFDFKSLSQNQKTIIIQDAINEITSNFSGPESNPFEEDYYDDSGGNGDVEFCAGRRSACKQSAYGNYIIIVTGCVAGVLV
ncbi:hypothetical protein QGN23_12680 [Chryseobacterium gotjawalense]|uniref:Lipoprotein n=1 Tax=Chryseobacterium gotjawalense TaxID=3042315 RepID=A0ABY8RE02_9FLAO|nr:hypothetical protein [Chryseobacterium sp. wdc7]WHF51277.1 hypothetical protein QGN23_12680 [Chryseobacterium sp. wdc7]